jgi:TldD protein
VRTSGVREEIWHEHAATLREDMLRHRPVWAREVSAALEHGFTLKGRFAGGNLTEMSLRRLAGAGLRCHTEQGLRFVAADRPGPDLVDRLYRDGSPNAGTDAAASAAERPPVRSAADSPIDLDATRTFLSAVDAAARGADARINQLLIDFQVVDRHVVLATDEALRSVARPLVYLTCRAIAADGDTLAAGFFTPGLRGGLDGLDAEEIGREAARRAVDQLSARPAPLGRMPVVVAGGRGIVLLHEACCHPLEADEVLRGSVYAGREGTQIAADCVSIMDDPSVPDAVGGYEYDDEGVPAAPTSLVENGLLRGFLTDADSARRLGLPRTGNGRCASVADAPIPRMSNTCLLPGRASPEEIIAATPHGIYAEHVGGGEVTEATGEFVFRVTNGYLIRDGALAEPIAEVTVAGAGADVLRDIDMVGDDVRAGAALCGKFGQYVPVGVVGPTLRVRSLLVGGTTDA